MNSEKFGQVRDLKTPRQSEREFTFKGRPCYQGITLWALRAEPKVHAVIPWQQGLTLCNKGCNQWSFSKKFPFKRSFWLTFCALGILQFYILQPRDLFVSMITKCSLPYKYTRNALRGCYMAAGSPAKSTNHIVNTSFGVTNGIP